MPVLGLAEYAFQRAPIPLKVLYWQRKGGEDLLGGAGTVEGEQGRKEEGEMWAGWRVHRDGLIRK